MGFDIRCPDCEIDMGLLVPDPKGRANNNLYRCSNCGMELYGDDLLKHWQQAMRDYLYLPDAHAMRADQEDEQAEDEP